MTTPIDRQLLDRAREQAGVSVISRTRFNQRLRKHETRWFVLQDDSVAHNAGTDKQAEQRANLWADDLALDLIEQGAIGELA